MSTITTFGSTPSLEDMKLPGDRRCGDLSQGPLYGEFAKLVPEFNHTLGRTDALALYSRRLQAIHDEAGKAAVAAWLAANK
jgi:hypothetical protein